MTEPENNDEKIGYILAKIEEGATHRAELRETVQNVQAAVTAMDKKLDDLTLLLRIFKFIVFALGSIALFKFRDVLDLWRDIFKGMP